MPGQVVFVMSNDYTDGGYFGIVVDKHRRDGEYIIRRNIGELFYSQVVPNNIMRRLTDYEVEKYQDDLRFLISKYNEFDFVKEDGNKMKVILIWNEVNTGKGISLYLLESVSDEDIDLLNKANGKYTNLSFRDEKSDISAFEESVIRIYDFISEDKDLCFDKENKDNCKWSGKKLKITNGIPIINESINRVYTCGGYLGS